MKDEIKNEIKKIADSKTIRRVIYGFGILTIALLIFQAGMIAGFHKASFGRDWGDNYAMNFGPSRGGPWMMDGRINNFPNAHGAIGKIIKVELPVIVVLDENDNTEKAVIINDKTEIRQGRNSVDREQLKVDDHIVILGTPNSSGQIEARLIRFLPVPLQAPIKVN